MSINQHYCKIIAKHSDMVVAVEAAATINGARVIQYPWKGGDEQIFLFTDLGDNHYRLTPKHSGMVIGKGADFIFPRNDVIQWNWSDNDDNQKFRITPVAEGYYKLEPYSRLGKVLAVGGASKLADAPLVIWDWHDTDEQKFQIVPVDEPLHNIPWSVNIHPEDVGLSDREGVLPDPAVYKPKIDAALRLTKELGARLVRIDFSWKRLFDSTDELRHAVNAFYDYFTETAQAQGIGIICILLRCPTRLEKNGDWNGFVDEFCNYCLFVAARWGKKISSYQIWNEANHILPAKNPIKYYFGKADAAQLFLAGDAALQVGGGNHVSMINIMCNNDWLWEKTLETWVNQLDAHPHSIRTIGIDHYPGTWTATGYHDWWPLERVAALLKNRNYNWAIAETGYASGIWKDVPLGHTPEEQKRWVEVSIEALYKKLRYNHAIRDGLQYINLYELYDVNPAEQTIIESLSPFERYFGICDFNGHPKLAFSALQRMIEAVK